MEPYTLAQPTGVAFDENVSEFFKDFYRVSDTPGLTTQYVNMFTKDATFILGSNSSQGSEGIASMREAMWNAVASRTHKLGKIFPFGDDSSEVMLYGSVDLTLKNGDTKQLDWAARAQLSRDEGGYKMKFYQVYLDTGATAAYKKS
ncbi:hypothetical protein NM208_g13678 [Fusarium decemcellulare]|uniref:Uncharacterized protein n=1 Tax=Fusarium decemcellulare TaxID=57161 RepID=A0ACC1RJI1_9HYPO|nr:hypothetical protein NM208_g13678 [Fusarium decemcellulare]